ncbi:MAG: response regulator [Pararhodobacter sp.]|nr:response regulator [Pararhodobacter sp.]
MHADGRSRRRAVPVTLIASSHAPGHAPGPDGDNAGPGGPAPVGARDAPGDETQARARQVVLVIEDEPNIAEAIRFILSRDGWQVLTHGEGRDALARIEAIAPQLLILDVMLPGRSGIDILQELRGHERLRDLPVIMLTAKGQAIDRETALRHGASLFMSKPFSNADLLAAARRFAGS